MVPRPQPLRSPFQDRVSLDSDLVNGSAVRWIIGVLLMLLTGSSNAVTIHWGNAVFDTLIQNEGTPLDAGFKVEIGAFSTNFDPDTADMATWRTNWKVFDQAQFNASAGYFAGSANLLADQRSDSLATAPLMPTGPTFTQVDQVYVWVYNSDSVESGTEWALLTNPYWTFPDASDADQQDMPLNWRISDVGTRPVFGGVTNTEGSFSSETGLRLDQSSSFHIQTHGVIPIPEPSSMLLVGVGLLGLLGRSRSGSLTKCLNPDDHAH